MQQKTSANAFCNVYAPRIYKKVKIFEKFFYIQRVIEISMFAYITKNFKCIYKVSAYLAHLEKPDLFLSNSYYLYSHVGKSCTYKIVTFTIGSIGRPK